jgi:hypothetical protein
MNSRILFFPLRVCWIFNASDTSCNEWVVWGCWLPSVNVLDLVLPYGCPYFIYLIFHNSFERYKTEWKHQRFFNNYFISICLQRVASSINRTKVNCCNMLTIVFIHLLIYSNIFLSGYCLDLLISKPLGGSKHYSWTMLVDIQIQGMRRYLLWALAKYYTNNLFNLFKYNWILKYKNW